MLLTTFSRRRLTLERAAGFLPVYFPKHDGLLTILNCNWITRLQLIPTARSLGSRIADEAVPLLLACVHGETDGDRRTVSSLNVH